MSSGLKAMDSHWVEAVLPGNPSIMATMDERATNMNLWAMLLNAGAEESVYPDFKPILPLEMCCFIALYIWQGLSPSPQVKMKFKLQHVDPVNGSN